MIDRKIEFYSEGYKLDGSLYLPDNYDGKSKLQLVIVNSGYQGFNAFYPKMFSAYLTQHGFACLGFDYRGFAESEGPRGRVVMNEQVQDIKNAINFAFTRPEIAHEQIGLLGWGMGASNVITLAATDKRVKAVAAINGFYDGERWLKSTHTKDGWQDILAAVEEDRARRVTTGKSKRISPFTHYLLDPATNGYVQKELSPLIEKSGTEIDLQFTESIIASKADQLAASISPRPLFIAHGKDNLLHPKHEAEALYEAALEPKTLYWIDGQHNDFTYTGNPVLEALVGQLMDFYAVLGKSKASKPKAKN